MAEIPKKTLVTGAAGAVGPLLVRELAERGHRVRALVRNEENGLFPKGTEQFAGDLRDGDFLREAVRGVDLIFHFGAKLHTNDPDEELAAEYEAVNVRATADLLEYASCKRFVFASTINVYGEGDRETVFDENSKTDPLGIYAASKARAEKLVLGHEGGTVLRFAAIYGERMKGNFPRLVSAIRSGRFALVGGGMNRRTLVHERDAVKAAILCFERVEAKQRIYNVTDGEIHTLREIVGAISAAMGKKPPRVDLPAGPVKAILKFTDLVAGVAGIRTGFAATLDKMLEDMAVSGARIRNELGFESGYGLEEGWRIAVKSKDR